MITQLIPDHACIIVGLSGGPDSVYLLHRLTALRAEKKITLIAAHLDHEWRAESGEDVKFCQNLAAKYGVQLVTRKLSELPAMPKFNGSKEEFARQARRRFFALVKKETNADYVALAHHKDDQAETFFIRLIRGAGLTGLTGMRARDGIYLRPLLHLSKAEILDYLHTNNLAYLHDYTNDSADFLRNRIRQTVVPALRACDARFDQSMMHSIEKLQEADLFLQELTAQELERVCTKNGEQLFLTISLYHRLHPFMQHRVLLHFLCQHALSFTPTAAFFAEVNRFLQKPENGAHALHTSWRIEKKNDKAFITYNR